jgi:hypothetical protein
LGQSPIKEMKINYDVTIPEIEIAFMQFWRKYQIKQTLMFSVVFLIAMTLSLNMIITGNRMVGGILLGLSAGLLANLWLKPRRACKKIVTLVGETLDEKHSANFSESSIEIETVIEDEVTTAVYQIAEEELYCNESESLFVIFVNRSHFQVIPKRCLSEEETEKLRSYFEEKKI